MDEGLRKDYLKHNIISVLIILVIILIGLIGYKLIQKSGEPKYEEWEMTEYGDIVVTMKEEEEEEILPDNIVDAYGLEYEYVKLPSVGISTYKPVGWDVLFDEDFFYFLAPEDDEKYPHVEIGICVVNIGSLSNTYDRTFVQEYFQTNIKNHNTMTLESKLITDNDYVEIKDDNGLFAYYGKPSIDFRVPDDVTRGGWTPYTVVYMLNTDSDITTICCVSGPKMAVDGIDEIAKTLAYNTKKYENTNFDFKELIDVKMKKVSLKDMTYMVKDERGVSASNNAQSELLVESTATGNFYTLSDDITSLAFNEKLVVLSGWSNGSIDDFMDNTFMSNVFMQSSQVYASNAAEFTRKSIAGPKFEIESTEKLEIANKEARKVTWKATMNNDDVGRSKVDSIMPKMFTTYLIHNGNNIYSLTISYTKYQKYAANEYLNKTIETIGFN